MPHTHQVSDTLSSVFLFRTALSSNNLFYCHHKFVHILTSIVERKGGTHAHLIAQGAKSRLCTMVTGTHGNALLVEQRSDLRDGIGYRYD